MLQPFPQKNEPSIDPISVNGFIGLYRCRNLFLAAVHQNLVRIEKKDPLVGKGNVGQGPILFLGPTTLVIELNNFRTVLRRQPASVIRALRIDDVNLGGPRNRPQASLDVARLVSGRNNHTDRIRHRLIFLTTRAGIPAQTVLGGTSLVTTLPAPTTLPSPMVTPIKTIARAATHAFFPTTIAPW